MVNNIVAEKTTLLSKTVPLNLYMNHMDGLSKLESKISHKKVLTKAPTLFK